MPRWLLAIGRFFSRIGNAIDAWVTRPETGTPRHIGRVIMLVFAGAFLLFWALVGIIAGWHLMKDRIGDWSFAVVWTLPVVLLVGFFIYAALPARYNENPSDSVSDE